MEFTFEENKITLEKELNSLDEFVIAFCKKLQRHGIKYSIVSGYVAIVFGRSRATEDVDIIVDQIDKEKFFQLWKDISTDFECFNAESKESAFDMLISDDAIRFSRPNNPMPNVEFKFAYTLVEKHTCENALKLELNKHQLFISPLELQIAYKLYLGSDKDIEDATHLYTVFRQYLNKGKLSNYFVLLKVPRENVDLLG